MHWTKQLGCAIFALTATQAAAQSSGSADSKPIPHQGYMSVLLTDKCVITAGRAMPQDKRFDRAVSHIEYQVAPDTALADVKNKALETVGAALAVEGAKQVIKFGFDRVETAVKDAAKDRVSGFDAIAAINAFDIHPREAIANPKDAKSPTHLHRIKLNPALRCLTVVTSVDPVTNRNVTAKTAQIFTGTASAPRTMDPWKTSGDWERYGPPTGIVDTRLNWSGFRFFSNQPATIFEARLDFSQDFSAVRLVPLYFEARNFADKSGKITDKGTRFLSTTINISDPTNPKKPVLSHTFKDIKVKIASGITTIGLASTTRGFGPDLTAALFADSGWLPFAAPSPKVSKALTKELQDGTTEITDTMGLRPINVAVTHVATEKASEFALQLAKFFKDQDVASKLSTALIDELDLKTPGEQAAAELAQITSQLAIVDAQLAYFKAVGGQEEAENALLEKKHYLTLQKAVLTVDCTLNSDLDPLPETVDPEKIQALGCL